MTKVENGPSMPQGICSLVGEVRPTHKVSHSDLWLWVQEFTEGRLHGPGGKALLSTASLRKFHGKTATMRLIPCPPPFLLHCKHKRCPLTGPQETLCPVILLRSVHLFADSLRQPRQGLNSHLKIVLSRTLITNYSDIALGAQLSHAGFYPASGWTMPEEIEEAPIATSPLGAWRNTDVTAAERSRNIAIEQKGPPLYKEMKERHSEILEPGKWYCNLIINLDWV